MRLTKAQRQKLTEDAGMMTVGQYVRSRLFDNPTPLKRAYRRRPLQDEKALSQVLGALGKSRLSSNLNQLAKAVHSGSLPVTPETEQAILDAVKEVKDMSVLLVQALGLPEDKKGSDGDDS